MSEYFTNFKKIDYNINKVKPLITTKSVNILNRPVIRDKILSNITSYYDYVVQETDRADTIAYDYYGSASYTWLVLLANDITDPYYDWPLFGNNFDNYIIKKYGGIQEATTKIHHYEEVLREETTIYDEVDGYKKLLERAIVVDKIAYDNSSNPKREVSCFDYEIIKRDKKRNIILVDNAYAKQIQDEFRIIFR
tara:strand:+ start:1540 stop:2121 length:582 start_codon:yes stop_codon:yes gene_type:complete